jgi:hypothetical protein
VSSLAAAVDRWWYAPAPAARLAALRLAVGCFALGYLVVRWPNLVSYAMFDDRRFAPVGVVSLVGEPVAGDLARLLVAAAVVCGVAFVAGWRYRISGPLFALLLLWVTTYRNSFGQVFHTEDLMVLHVLILALAPAADAWSLDARRKETPADSGWYGWAVQLMCLVTVLTYFVTGETKLRNAGLDWVTSDSLRNYVAYDNLRKSELGDVHSPLASLFLSHAWLFHPLAVFTLAVELGAPLAMLGNRVARVWAAAAWGFHLGVLALMAIVFPYPLLGVAFAPFFPLERLRLPSRLPVPGRSRRLAEG